MQPLSYTTARLCSNTALNSLPRNHMIYRVIHIPKDSATNVTFRPHRHNNNDMYQKNAPPQWSGVCPALLCLHAYNYARHRFGVHGDGRSICVVILRLPDWKGTARIRCALFRATFQACDDRCGACVACGTASLGKGMVCLLLRTWRACSRHEASECSGEFARPLRTVDLYA